MFKRLLGMTDEERQTFEETHGIKAETANLLIEQAVAATQTLTASAIREIQSVVGPHGALSRVQAGNMKIAPGIGIGVFADGVLKTTIDPDGNFFVGSQIDNPANTTFSVFVNDQVYNNEQMGAGDLLIGDNTSGVSNIKYDASEGQLQFRLGTTVNVYMDTDGTLKAGSGAISLDSSGITFENNSGVLRFKDSTGVYDSTHGAAIYGASDDALLLQNNKVGKQIQLTIKLTNGNTPYIKWWQNPSEANAAYLQIDGDSTEPVLLRIGGSGAGNSGVEIWVNEDGKETVFNDNSFDIDFRVETATNADGLKIDAGNETVSLVGVLVVDGGNDKRLEIGADHYIPTRNAANKTTYFNEANQDMDFNVQGQTDGNLIYVDASTDRVGIGTNTPAEKLDVVGNITLSGQILGAGSPKAETNADNVFLCTSPGGTSAWTGTFVSAGSSGTTIKATTVSGTAASMVPAATTQLGKMVLYNTTRGNSVLITNCVTGAPNTITSTANFPANWANGDALTIASQTVSGGGFAWVDIQITSGPTSKVSLFVNMQAKSATVGDTMRLHPFATFGSNKVLPLVAQVANTQIDRFGLLEIASDKFALSWTGTPTTVLVREAGYLA